MPSNYQTYVYDFCGAIAGYDTVQKINEKLYYLGSDYNVYCYTGAEPIIISKQLNEFVPAMKLSQITDWSGKPKLLKQYTDYKSLADKNNNCHAYAFQYGGNYYLSVNIMLVELSTEKNVTFLGRTLKYDDYLQLWYPVDDNVYRLFNSSEENRYSYTLLGSNAIHTFNLNQTFGDGKSKRINKGFYCVLSPINMGNMLSKNFKAIRVRFTSLTEEDGDHLNIGYAIDNERFFTTTKVSMTNKSVVEIPLARVGEEVTIGFQGNGIILIKGIEIEYEVLESCV